MAQGMLFNIPKRDMTKEKDRTVIIGNKTITINEKVNYNNIASIIRSAKERLKGKDFSRLELVMDEKRFKEYMYNYRSNGIGAIDTETEGLNPITNKIAGINLYTPKEKGIYVPINHVDYITGSRVEGQVDQRIIIEELNKLKLAKTKDIYHNSKFDMKFMRWQLGNYKEVDMTPYWDTQIAGHMLNENESHALKYLHQKYCTENKENKELDTYSKLFEGILFSMIPVEIAYLYAAYDPIMTYELYEFQKQFLDECGDWTKQQGLEQTAKLFKEVEMPIVEIVADMEDYGVAIDVPFAEELSAKYHKQLEVAQEDINKELAKIESKIREFGEEEPLKFAKLENPVNISSPPQLGILLYDILHLESNDSQKPRGTGKDILAGMKHPIAKLITAYRKVAKLLTTYIDKMPKEINKKTGKVHANFNGMGTVTGRFSSSGPNLQNIPSKNHDIRKMFVAAEGYVLVAGDYSQQEPRATAHVSQDENMLNAYKTGKDIYATIASIAFNHPYEDCLEFHADGSEYPEGKGRRGKAKVIVLGLTYGMSDKGLADGMDLTMKEAQNVMEQFFEGFPMVKKAVDKNLEDAKITGFVQTIWGRKRRLPDLLLEPYVITDLFDEEISSNDRLKWLGKIQKAFGRFKKMGIIKEAVGQGVKIIDNTGKISSAERQAFNSKIQGSAADITKKAMLAVGSNLELKELDYHMIMTVHDEIIGTCPEANAVKARDIVERLMIGAPTDLLSIPMEIDMSVMKRWYGKEIQYEDFMEK